MMHEQERKSGAQQDETIDATQVPKAEVAVERQPTTDKVPPAASFSELTGQPKTEAKKAEPLANTEAMIEQLAHGMVAKELDDNDRAFLAANGYDALPIIRGVHEFVMRTFVPTQAGKPPIVAFRGTVPSKVQTLIADLDPSGIGVYQFNPNRALIQAQMQAAATHGKVVSSGHSLGGALAQIAAATFPDLVERIVTFQAPGVSKETAQALEKYNAEHPDDAIESSHHRVKGDLVPMGGEALTPGVIHNHEMTGGNVFQRNPLAKHTALPLAQEQIAQGIDVPIHGDRDMTYTGDVSTEKDNAEKSQIIEHARAGLGHLVFGVGSLFSR
ncbi:MAG TPA: Mbeg1-like protein [Kofleriaceae bacterium]